jgi:hypothetical protein
MSRCISTITLIVLVISSCAGNIAGQQRPTAREGGLFKREWFAKWGQAYAANRYS